MSLLVPKEEMDRNRRIEGQKQTENREKRLVLKEEMRQREGQENRNRENRDRLKTRRAGSYAGRLFCVRPHACATQYFFHKGQKEVEESGWKEQFTFFWVGVKNLIAMMNF